MPDLANHSLQTEPSGAEKGRSRGQLKIFFGYAAGVGKTYAMLKAAHAARRKGVDVVVGYVRSHSRPQTASLISGLEKLPTLMVREVGERRQEFDLDAAIARKPQLIVVDELAHSNASICRHSKRYQDIEELLQSGIDVYTTVGVQHIESLNDTVTAITGTAEVERIPDSVFDRADQVELVDMEPSELVERMGASRAYREERAKAEIPASLSIEQLTDLRELALRRCADRVNEGARAHGRGEHRTEEHILVGISSAPSNARIIRTAARMARAFHARFTALHVETPGFAAMDAADKKRLRAHMRLAHQLGAAVETVYGEDVPRQIAEFSNLSGVSKIVLGRTVGQGKRLLGRPTLTDRLISIAPAADIHIIPDNVHARQYRMPRLKWGLRGVSSKDIITSVLVFLGASALGVLFSHWGLNEANIIMVYILGVLITSVVTTHRMYSVFSAIASILAFNYLFLEPIFALKVYGTGYQITFVIMFITALITGRLAAQLKEHARQSGKAAYRTRVLFETDQLLNRATSREEIISALADQLGKLLQRDIVVYLVENGEVSLQRLLRAKSDGDKKDLLTREEKDVVQWVMKNNRHAGATTDTFSGAQCLYLAIRVNDSVHGVVGIAAQESPLDSFEHSILLSILGECALALENEKNAREKEAAAILAKNEQLRANLLRAISHDLRTPLTSISGNASNLLSNAESLDEDMRRQMYGSIYDDSMWLIMLVENLLAVTRIEEGKMSLKSAPEMVDEIISEALRHVHRRSGEHAICVENQDELILVRVDARLIVQVIINIVDNAIKYTPPGSRIIISTEKKGKWVEFVIADDGPGISDEMKPKVFEMFYSGANRVADSRRSLGLGLSLCKSIVSAHGGSIQVRDNVPHGARFVFTLPAEEMPIPHERDMDSINI